MIFLYADFWVFDVFVVISECHCYVIGVSCLAALEIFNRRRLAKRYVSVVRVLWELYGQAPKCK